MGVLASQLIYARYRNGSHRRYDQRATQRNPAATGRRWIGACLIWLAANAAFSDTIRIATFNTELDRSGPGLLLRDIRKGDDEQVIASLDVIAHVAPDILILQRFDYDHDLAALRAFADALKDRGHDMPHLFAKIPNSGIATGLDMDGDNRFSDARDAQGYGEFAGQRAMAIMSRFPINYDEARDFSDILWRDLPGATLPQESGSPFPSLMAQQIQRLSSVAHWDVPVFIHSEFTVRLLVWHASTPAFDGVENRNGLRNADETRFWSLYLGNRLFPGPPDHSFVVAGVANADPIDGDGSHETISGLLNNPLLQDPQPVSDGGRNGSRTGANRNQLGDPALDTANWPEVSGKPGNLRVDYVLPSHDLTVKDAGVFWPDGGQWAKVAETASRHRLVWVDIETPH